MTMYTLPLTEPVRGIAIHSDGHGGLITVTSEVDG